MFFFCHLKFDKFVMTYQNRIQLLKSEAKPADDINISEVMAKRKRDFFQNLAHIYEKKTTDTKNTTKIFKLKRKKINPSTKNSLNAFF